MSPIPRHVDIHRLNAAISGNSGDSGSWQNPERSVERPAACVDVGSHRPSVQAREQGEILGGVLERDPPFERHAARTRDPEPVPVGGGLVGVADALAMRLGARL
jgi:hypothetical protein